MPIVEVTYRADIPDAEVHALATVLPELVSLAVASGDEPYQPPLQPGDVELRFRPLGPFDVSDLDAVIEICSKWSGDRELDRQRRCDRLRDELAALFPHRRFGVYLSLPVAAWAQTAVTEPAPPADRWIPSKPE